MFKRKIAFTNSVIDKSVYELYSLKEEEIRIAEGNNGHI